MKQSSKKRKALILSGVVFLVTQFIFFLWGIDIFTTPRSTELGVSMLVSVVATVWWYCMLMICMDD